MKRARNDDDDKDEKGSKQSKPDLELFEQVSHVPIQVTEWMRKGYTHGQTIGMMIDALGADVGRQVETYLQQHVVGPVNITPSTPMVFEVFTGVTTVDEFDIRDTDHDRKYYFMYASRAITFCKRYTASLSCVQTMEFDGVNNRPYTESLWDDLFRQLIEENKKDHVIARSISFNSVYRCHCQKDSPKCSTTVFITLSVHKIYDNFVSDSHGTT